MELQLIVNVLVCVLAVFAGARLYARMPKVYTGENWTAKRVGGKYVLSVKNHAELADALTDFVAARQITAGAITGIGAVCRADLRFFNPKTKKYVDKTFKDQMEIANLTGNIARIGGKPSVHVHVTLGGSDYKALAGHLLNAQISGAGEFVVADFKGVHNEKAFDADTGLNLYDLTKK